MWLFAPSVCLPDAEDWTSPSDLLCQTLASFATWSGKQLPPRSWRRVLQTAHSIRLLSGLTCEPSTADAGVAAWISSWADSPAPIYRSPESAPESTANIPACGGSTPESYARFNPDGSLSKTSRQLSLMRQDEPYSENFTPSGSMRSGSLYERPTLGRRTNGSGSSSWPTARSEDSECAGNHPGATGSLTGATKEWQTPAVDSFRSLGGDRRDEMGLDQQARLQWTTPKSRDYKSAEGGAGMTRHEPDLNLQACHSSLPAPQTTTAGAASSTQGRGSRRRLNPAFVAWLMGWPEWWTYPEPINSARQEMESWRCKARSLLQFFLSGR